MSLRDLFPAVTIPALLAVPLMGVALTPTGRGSSPQASRGLLLVANKGDQTVGLIDPASGREIATIKETGFTTHELVASPDGRLAYAPTYGNSGVGSPGTDGRTIDVISIPERRVIKVIDLGHGARPHCIRYNPRDGLLYVTTEITDSITVIDPKTDKVVGSIPTGQPQSHMLALTPDGRRGYTANVGPGTVSVLDLKTRKETAIIPVAKEIQRISVSMDGRWAFTSDQHSPRLAVIDTRTNKIARWVELPGIGYGTTPTLDGKYLLIAIINKDKVAVLNLKSMKIARTIPVPHAPQEIVVRPDDRVAYVSCSQTRKVAAINLKTWKVEKLISAGRGVDGMAWAGEP
jgi:YVTN family beta-propeller protein